jgi:nucleoside-diphosphate-sugar epimerase
MRIFLTGGAGYVGSGVLDALVRAGYQVDALVRNSEKAAQVQARGATPLVGDLTSPASYEKVAREADAVIHAAVASGPQAPQVDTAALDALLTPVDGRRRAFIYTSGVWVLGPCPTPADESAPVRPIAQAAWRAPQEQRVLAAATSTLRTVVVRPGVVYGGSGGIVGDLLRSASNGLVRVVGSGDNHWPLVHERDLGELYVRLASMADAAGVYHANDEGDERVNDLVTAIAGHVPIPPSIRRVPMTEASRNLGAYAEALALDQIVRSPRARGIGWQPALRSVAGNAARLLEEWRRGRRAA